MSNDQICSGIGFKMKTEKVRKVEEQIRYYDQTRETVASAECGRGDRWLGRLFMECGEREWRANPPDLDPRA